jgi:hypothetical protein
VIPVAVQGQFYCPQCGSRSKRTIKKADGTFLYQCLGMECDFSCGEEGLKSPGTLPPVAAPVTPPVLTPEDVCLRYHGGADTSAAAFASLDPAHYGERGRLIWDTIKAKGEAGATCEELERELGIKHQSCSAMITHLRKDGSVFDSGRRRLTTSGRKARVYVTGKL